VDITAAAKAGLRQFALIADAAGFMMEVSDVANPAEPGLRMVIELQDWKDEKSRCLS
jgi:hypothetical protein